MRVWKLLETERGCGSLLRWKEGTKTTREGAEALEQFELRCLL